MTYHYTTKRWDWPKDTTSDGIDGWVLNRTDTAGRNDEIDMEQGVDGELPYHYWEVISLST